MHFDFGAQEIRVILVDEKPRILRRRRQMLLDGCENDGVLRRE
jgi:hypothetical protein